MMPDKKQYSLRDRLPFAPIHPGEMLLDELQARGISQRKFAEMIECSCSFLNEIIRGKRSISALTACRIEAATGIDAQVWVNLQSAYDMQVARNDKKFSSLLAKIRRAAAVV